jgi:hypothetical protein
MAFDDERDVDYILDEERDSPSLKPPATDPLGGYLKNDLDAYIEQHPYLGKATSAQERLIFWLAKQPDWRAIARMLAESDYERDGFIREQARNATLDELERRFRDLTNHEAQAMGVGIITDMRAGK